MTKEQKLQKLRELKDPLLSKVIMVKGDKGEKGDKGDMGPQGYTPVRGKDYYTESEINFIISYIQSNVKDGEKGDKGDMGLQGIEGKHGQTPIRGIDYWSPKDQEKILQSVLSKIPKPLDIPKTEDVVNLVIDEIKKNPPHLQDIKGTKELIEFLKRGGFRGGGGSGGGGTPSTPDKSLQYNNGGVFGGITGSSFDNGSGFLTLTNIVTHTDPVGQPEDTPWIVHLIQTHYTATTNSLDTGFFQLDLLNDDPTVVDKLTGKSLKITQDGALGPGETEVIEDDPTFYIIKYGSGSLPGNIQSAFPYNNPPPENTFGLLFIGDGSEPLVDQVDAIGAISDSINNEYIDLKTQGATQIAQMLLTRLSFPYDDGFGIIAQDGYPVPQDLMVIDITNSQININQPTIGSNQGAWFYIEDNGGGGAKTAIRQKIINFGNEGGFLLVANDDSTIFNLNSDGLLHSGFLAAGFNVPNDVRGLLDVHDDQEAQPATGTITLSDNPADGDTITITDADATVATFEFDDGGGVLPGNIAVTIGATAGDTLNNLITAIESNLNMTADEVEGIAVLTDLTTGPVGNVDITFSGANIAVTGMSGGTDFIRRPDIYVDNDTGELISEYGAYFGGQLEVVGVALFHDNASFGGGLFSNNVESDASLNLFADAGDVIIQAIGGDVILQASGDILIDTLGDNGFVKTKDGNGTLEVVVGLSGTKEYYVSDTNGGTVDRKLTFIDGLLISES